VSVPLDLIDAGTEMVPLDPVVPVLALVPVPVLELVDDDVGAAAADDDVDDDELLLPHPTIAAAHSSGTAADSHVLSERIALLLFESQKSGGRIGNIAPGGGPPNPPQYCRSLLRMNVTVRLFAALRERAGCDEVALELPEGARVADALAQMGDIVRDVPVVMAVNREYADDGHALSAGDELALIPPVSGGSVGAAHVRVTEEPLALDQLVARVSDPRAGAVVSFTGVTRQVAELDYEAYVPMAERQMERIVAEAIERHGLCAAAVEHRIGTVPLSEASVAIAVSAPHRAEAFAGAREIIDEIKARAPIWKREEGEWVSGSRPSAEPPRPPTSDR
jgi:MoaE-MoaD fusion protein